MLIEWKTTKDLPEESLSELWDFLKDIKNGLEVDKPSTSISIPLFPKKCNNPIEKEWIRAFRKKLLRQLEKKEKVLETVKGTTKKDTDFAVVRIDENKFNSFYREIKKEWEEGNLMRKPQKDVSPSSLITRDTNGDFYYRGKLINFQSQNDIYYKVFVALFEESGSDGFCPYKKIDKYLIQEGEDKLREEERVIKRITNAVQNLFRFTKNLPNKAPNGKLIISTRRGEGLVIYNSQR